MAAVAITKKSMCSLKPRVRCVTGADNSILCSINPLTIFPIIEDGSDDLYAVLQQQQK